MAATYLEITELPLETIEGFQHKFRVTALDASGAIDAGYTGNVYFESSDPDIHIDPLFPLGGWVMPGGTRIWPVRFNTPGPQTLTAIDGVRTSSTARTTVSVRPPGWGFDDKGLLPYGDATSGIGAHLTKALAISTREVDVSVSNLVQDNSPFLAGDALNPATWLVQRLDTLAFLTVTSVTQIGTYTYRLLCLEEFGPVTATHRASSSVLRDVSGSVITSPQRADFLGLLDENKTSIQAQFAASNNSTRDIANPQVPSDNWFAGTLQLNAAGDYKLESGKQLVRKLILRRLISTPGDFFHMPGYGLGIQLKEPIPPSQLGALKTQIEQQARQEPEVEAARASVTLASNGVLTVKVRVTLRPTHESVDIGFKASDQGLVLL